MNASLPCKSINFHFSQLRHFISRNLHVFYLRSGYNMVTRIIHSFQFSFCCCFFFLRDQKSVRHNFTNSQGAWRGSTIWYVKSNILNTKRELSLQTNASLMSLSQLKVLSLTAPLHLQNSSIKWSSVRFDGECLEINLKSCSKLLNRFTSGLWLAILKYYMHSVWVELYATLFENYNFLHDFATLKQNLWCCLFTSNKPLSHLQNMTIYTEIQWHRVGLYSLADHGNCQVISRYIREKRSWREGKVKLFYFI